jgi:methionyl-tRNA synthetase
LVYLAKNNQIKKADLTAISKVAENMEEMGRRINRFIEDQAPWILAKDDSSEGQIKLFSVLRTGLEAVRLLFEAGSVIMPGISAQALGSLNIQIPQGGFKGLEFKLLALREGQKLGDIAVLFPKK